MPFQKGYTPWNKGRTGVYSEETLKKISEATRGENNPNYGKHRSEETRKKISEAMKGQLPWSKGKHHSEETRRKISEALEGHPVSQEIRRKISKAQKGHHHSEETRRKMSEAHKGEKHWNWKGGHERYYGPNWDQQKRLARERDKGICQDCGAKEDGCKHDTHHIIPFRVYGIERYEEANRLDNLMTLCMTCHRRIEAPGDLKT